MRHLLITLALLLAPLGVGLASANDAPVHVLHPGEHYRVCGVDVWQDGKLVEAQQRECP